MVLKNLLTPATLLLIGDWLYLLRKLRRHRQLLPANYYLSGIPRVGNLYLRLYFQLEKPIPGTNDPTIKDMRKGDALARACRTNVENDHAGGTGYTFI